MVTFELVLLAGMRVQDQSWVAHMCGIGLSRAFTDPNSTTGSQHGRLLQWPRSAARGGVRQEGTKPPRRTLDTTARSDRKCALVAGPQLMQMTLLMTTSQTLRIPRWPLA